MDTSKINLSIITGALFYLTSHASAYTPEISKDKENSRPPIPRKDQYPIQKDPYILTRREKLVWRPEGEDLFFRR